MCICIGWGWGCKERTLFFSSWYYIPHKKHQKFKWEKNLGRIDCFHVICKIRMSTNQVGSMLWTELCKPLSYSYVEVLIFHVTAYRDWAFKVIKIMSCPSPDRTGVLLGKQRDTRGLSPCVCVHRKRQCDDTVRTWSSIRQKERLPRHQLFQHLDLGLLTSRIVRK